MSNYTNKAKIGSGGSAEVWECELDGQCYAKKTLSDPADPEAMERFAREVRMLSSLDHPNIIRVIAKKLQTPPYYYIMPRYAYSLRTMLPDLVGKEERIVPIVLSILSAIEYAHAQGVIHRDLKPENVLMNNDADLEVLPMRWTDLGPN
jgi:serine/threonine protein kinase